MNQKDIQKQLEKNIQQSVQNEKVSQGIRYQQFEEVELQQHQLKSDPNECQRNIASSSNMNEPLLSKNQQNVNTFYIKRKKGETILSKIQRWIFGPQRSKTERKIYLNGDCDPQNYFQNITRNTKYTVLTFVPKVLVEQFKFFFNFFFLITAISQFFEALKVGFMITYLGPLIFVLVLTMMKEAYDDYQRYMRDREANSFKYGVLSSKGIMMKQASDLKVGDIIQVLANQRIPADLVLLHATDKNGSVFVRTDQLDGETDWKLRKSIRHTQLIVDKNIGEQQNYDSMNLNYLIQQTNDSSLKCNQPVRNIYEFEGVYKYIQEGSNNSNKEPLTLENTLWCNTVLASNKILGIVVFVGKETRIQMNSSTSRCKFGKLDQEINFLTKLLFIYLVCISMLMVILRGGEFSGQTFVVFSRYILLLCSIIPISMRVNLDFAKLLYSYKINKDEVIKGTITRNSNIPEELGRIQYLLSDKTGTLTQNDMIFKKLSLEQIQFNYEDEVEIKKIVRKNTEKFPNGIMEDIFNKQKQQVQNDQQQIYKSRKFFRRDKDSLVRDCINALALCHNVTPVIDKDNNQKTYQASSPDEIALVKIAEQLGVILISRNEQEMIIQNSLGVQENYQILNNFPFSSESKRMGIVIKQDSKIIFLLKGADVVMKNKVPEVQRGFLQDECEDLSSEGLRTLCFAYKYIEQSEYDQWNQQYIEATYDMKNRKQKIEKAIEDLERDLQFLCITGVEDKLQEDVSKTIENLRNAGINVWMLTGDKIETAKCIAISAGLRNDPSQQLYTIKEVEDQLELRHKLEQFSNMDSNNILVIDGTSLEIALTYYSQFFIESSCQAPAVVCCRCSPTQKAQITEFIKKYTHKTVACIGDGGNDVGMIQAADLGIGIVGKEGKQAALAADFSILQFKYLSRLLLWHGRNSYKRSAMLSQFVMHRGLIISQIQTVFTCIFYFVTMGIYNGMLNLGYSTIFTNLPIFCLIFDEDVNEQTAMEYPPLYKTLQKGRDLNLKTFINWCLKSLYQGTIIILLGIYMNQNMYFVNMVTITFSCLILTEFLNVYSELNSIHVVMIISQICSVLIYFVTISVMPETFDVTSLDGVFLWKMVVITCVSWFPFHLFKIIKKQVDPTDFEIIMKGVEQKIIKRI